MTAFIMTLGTALSTAAATAGTAAAGTAGAAGLGSTALTVLQGGLTLAGALGGIAAGGAQANQLAGQAAQEKIAARDAEIRGQEESARLKRELLDTVSSQSVAYAAGGVDLGSGSVRRARDLASKDAERELGFVQNDALRASLSHKHNARMLTRQGRAVRYGSVFKGLADMGQFAIGAAQRG